jgi:hypothetical protein
MPGQPGHHAESHPENNPDNRENFVLTPCRPVRRGTLSRGVVRVGRERCPCRERMPGSGGRLRIMPPAGRAGLIKRIRAAPKGAETYGQGLSAVRKNTGGTPGELAS